MAEDEHLPKWRAPVDVDDLRRYQTRAVKAAERIMYAAYDGGDLDTALEEAQERQQSNGTVLHHN